jgi:hypothetical protein
MQCIESMTSILHGFQYGNLQNSDHRTPCFLKIFSRAVRFSASRQLSTCRRMFAMSHGFRYLHHLQVPPGTCITSRYLQVPASPPGTSRYLHHLLVPLGTCITFRHLHHLQTPASPPGTSRYLHNLLVPLGTCITSWYL